MKTRKLLAVLSAMLCAIPPVRSLDLQGPPTAMIDLATTAGARSVQGQWHYSEVRIFETGFRDAEPGELSVYRDHSGYAGPDIAEYGQPGSNGLTLDPQGRLTISEHGNYRVTRLERDGAYHQGTVWTWLLGPFVSAHYRVYRDVAAARAWLGGIVAHLFDACLGSISEIADAEPPHSPRGCPAQAWGIAEVLRAWFELPPDTKPSSKGAHNS